MKSNARYTDGRAEGAWAQPEIACGVVRGGSSASTSRRRQLATAQRLNRKTGLGLELVEANAEVVPLRDASFDLAIS